MKLYSTTTNSRGKKTGQGDEEYMETLYNERNENRFLVAFDGPKLLVRCYGSGERYTLDYCDGLLKEYKGES